MTTAIETTVEFTLAQIAHRKACAFLKGILCGYSEHRGHTYHTTKERTPEFDKGFAIGCEGYHSPEEITAIHITHNRLRHNRPHISEEYDAGCTGWQAERLIKKHLGGDIFEPALEQAQVDLEVLYG